MGSLDTLFHGAVGSSFLRPIVRTEQESCRETMRSKPGVSPGVSAVPGWPASLGGAGGNQNNWSSSASAAASWADIVVPVSASSSAAGCSDTRGPGAPASRPYGHAHHSSPPPLACPPSGVAPASSAAPKRRHRGSGGGTRVGGKRHKSAAGAPLQQQQQQQQQRSSDSPQPQSSLGTGAGGSSAAGGAAAPMEASAEGGYNSEDEYSHLGMHLTEEEWLEKDRRFERAMKKKGYIIKHMNEDGSCLFRAVADQIFGDQEMHDVVRGNCMDYIEQNGDYFSQYITESLDTYVERKRYLGVHGNHLEIQALSEMYSRPIHIYCYSTEPINIFQALHRSSDKIAAPIRLCYHREIHYNSLVDPHKATIGLGLGLPGHSPGAADRNLLRRAAQDSEKDLVEKTMLEDKIKATDWEATNEAIEEQIARESYLQWLRDNERRNTAVKQRPAANASATAAEAAAAAAASSATVTSGELGSGSGGPQASCSSQAPVGVSPQVSAVAPAAAGVPVTNSPKAGCSSDRDSPKPGSSQQRSPRSSGGREHSSGNLGKSSHEFPVLETATFLSTMPQNMFGLDDWTDHNVLARVLADSQQEYFDNLKKQQQKEKQKQQHQQHQQQQQGSSEGHYPGPEDDPDASDAPPDRSPAPPSSPGRE